MTTNCFRGYNYKNYRRTENNNHYVNMKELLIDIFIIFYIN